MDADAGSTVATSPSAGGHPSFQMLPDAHSDFPATVTGNFWPLFIVFVILAGAAGLSAFFLLRPSR